ncbi:uncharacterized protein LOC116804103 [Drosophila mojavensis]|uniref:uncharacterized protein LOC116804103 n=1 Tax=Drosophila mojavensis TaxID=7230 RepID=UPI00017C98BF|nr:uncharacterized protein LOC116804103 [Drosophila mojavensis]
MLADRSLLVLCLGLFLCCESLPTNSLSNMRLPTPTPIKTSTSMFQSTDTTTFPVLQSIFTLPEICKEGFKLTGEPQRCRKIA